MSLTPGALLGPYELTAQIGVGGMGEVYRATDTNLKRQVAIKVLPESVAGDADRLARFQREAELLAQLNHPNIAQVHGLERAHGQTALVMELVDGPTLAERIDRLRAPGISTGHAGLPIDEVLSMAKQIAEALEEAHERGIVHRDLKPANIKVRDDGTVKVLDFGLAKAIERAGEAGGTNLQAQSSHLSHSPTVTSPAAITGVGVLLGTAAYMSPEQARGKVVDKRADIWAFGCVLFEMLTGERAFPGVDVLDTITAVVHASPEWQKLPPSTPGSVRRLLARCLEKDARKRLRDIGEARLILDERDSPAPASAQATVTSRSVRPLVTATIACVAALGAALMTAWLTSSATRAPGEPAPPMHVALPLAAGEVTEPLRGVAVSRDGRMVAFIARPGRGQPRLVVRRLDGQTQVNIENSTNATYPFFSPDGQWLGFFADDGLKKVPTAGGVPQEVVPIRSFNRGTGGVWADDGTIFFARTDGIWKAPSGGGNAEQVTAVRRDRGEINHLWPLVLPGSDTLLYVVWTGPGWDERHIVARRLGSGIEKVLVKGAATVRYAGSGHVIYSREGRLMAVPFDPGRLETSGPPVPLFDDVREGAAAADYDVSPGGTLFYVHQSRGAYNRVPVLVDRSGTERVLPGVSPGFYQNPRFSPDGGRALIQRADSTVDLWLYNFDRQTMAALRSDGSSQNPSWSPDGQRVVYRGTRGGSRNLFVRSVDGVSQEKRLTDSANVQLPWSWEAGTVAFVEQTTEDSSDVWLLRMDQNEQATRLFHTPYDETKPRLSPDGRTIAYVSDESGRNQVYVLVDGAKREQVSADGGTDPVWARNGRELYYRNGQRVMVVSMGPAGSVVSAPRVLFEGNYVITAPALDFDVSPDGERFLMLRTAEPEPAPAHIELFLNWNEPLKRLAPPSR